MIIWDGNCTAVSRYIYNGIIRDALLLYNNADDDFICFAAWIDICHAGQYI